MVFDGTFEVLTAFLLLFQAEDFDVRSVHTIGEGGVRKQLLGGLKRRHAVERNCEGRRVGFHFIGVGHDVVSLACHHIENGSKRLVLKREGEGVVRILGIYTQTRDKINREEYSQCKTPSFQSLTGD